MAEDYGSMFANFQVNPGLAPGSPTTGGGGFMDGLSSALTNPTLQTLLLNIGGAMAPKDFAGNLATSVRPMMQSRALVDALKGMQAQNTPNAVAQVDPMVKAKELSTASSLLKKAAEISPTVVPGFGDMMKKAVNTEPIGNAFSAKPELTPNPTRPIGDEIAGQAPVGTLPNVQPFSFNLSPDVAGAMTPEQIMAAYTYGSAQKKQELDIQKQINDNLIAPAQVALLKSEAGYKNWQMMPQRVEEHIRINTAPVLAQLEVIKGKDALALQQLQNWIATNPGLAKLPSPHGGTIGDWMTLNAMNPEGAKTASSLMNAGLHYATMRYTADMHYKGMMANAAASRDLKQFEIDTKMYEKANSDIAKWEAAPTEQAWKTMDQLQRMNLAAKGITGPRTPALVDAIKKSVLMRDTIGRKLYGPAYNDIKKMEQEAGKNGSTFVADPVKLKTVQDMMKKGQEKMDFTGTDPESPGYELLRMFGNKGAALENIYLPASLPIPFF